MATPCTAPFVGTAISVALSQNALYSILIFLFMGMGKSMPYIIFIVYPHIINFFPKPGKWFAYLKYFFCFSLNVNSFMANKYSFLLQNILLVIIGKSLKHIRLMNI